MSRLYDFRSDNDFNSGRPFCYYYYSFFYDIFLHHQGIVQQQQLLLFFLRYISRSNIFVFLRNLLKKK